MESDVFEIMGSLSTTKGSVTYDGETLTRCLKMESSTSVTFTLSTSGTMRLVFLESFTGAVKVDDTKYTATAGIATVDLAAGSHTITKADVSFLFLIVIDLDENGSSSASTESSSSSEESTAIQTQLANIPAGISFNRQTSHLTVGCAAVSRVEIFSISGEKVLHSANGAQVFNLDMLPSGIYLVRANTAEGMQQMKFFKE